MRRVAARVGAAPPTVAPLLLCSLLLALARLVAAAELSLLLCPRSRQLLAEQQPQAGAPVAAAEVAAQE